MSKKSKNIIVKELINSCVVCKAIYRKVKNGKIFYNGKEHEVFIDHNKSRYINAFIWII